MEGCRRKLKCLSIPEKVKVIETVDRKDKSKQEIVKEFDIPISTLSTILKKKDEILTRFRIGDCTRKRKREAELPSVEQATVKWLKQCRDGDARISGPMLQEKAENYTKTLGHDDFRASNGWLQKYKQRNGAVMPDCRGVGESRIYSKRAKKSPFAGFVPQSGITGTALFSVKCVERVRM